MELMKTEQMVAPVVEYKHVVLRDKLKVILESNSTNYFIYRGEPMGFQYEMFKLMAEDFGVKLKLKTNNNLPDSFDKLYRGRVDIIGMGLSVTDKRLEKYNMSVAHSYTNQHLVQRKSKDEDYYISKTNELFGKTITVSKASAFVESLEKISKKESVYFDIDEDDKFENEQLIKMVADGKIDYTVADSDVAKVNSEYYPNLDISLRLNSSDSLCWALRKDSEVLTQKVNQWLSKFKTTKRYRVLVNKYFNNKSLKARFNSKDFPLNSGKISDYDELIKLQAKSIDWDWLLIAALVKQESSFNPKAKSWAGAYGLMQLMPSTAEMYGVDSLSTVYENIKAGVKYLKYLEGRMKKKLRNEKDLIKFVLASYNAGIGHVDDARALARKNGKDPDIWTGSVDYYLLNKSKPEFYKDPLVKHGYCRGLEPYNYVIDILERYKHYKNIKFPQK
jgi:membrane-bound lytic murein transglycosylase F